MNQFLEEILSQARALKKTYLRIIETSKSEFLQVKDFIKKGGINKLIFTGMGSSFICAYLPYYILNRHGIAVEVREAGEFLFNTFPLERQETFKDTGIILISQSGESGEIRELLKRINEVAVKPLTVGITNNPDSYLAYRTELQIIMNLEAERSVSSTTYVCTLLILYAMAKTIIGQLFKEEKQFDPITQMITEVETLLNTQNNLDFIWNDLVVFMGLDIHFLEILGNGASMTTAYQAALNFKEIAKLPSEASSLSNFRHGAIEFLNNKSKLIILTSNNQNPEIIQNFLRRLIEEWDFGKLILITNQQLSPEMESLHQNPKIKLITHKVSDPFLAPIYEIIILQLLFYKVAENMGLEPGKFLFSEKITKDL